MQVTIHPGNTLWDELNRMGFPMDRPCGGNGTCGACKVFVEGLGEVKSCRFREAGSYEVTLKQQVAKAPLETIAAPETMETPSLFLDLGTTGVAGIFIGPEGRKEISFINPQRRYGADVMSRIRVAQEGNGDRLRELIHSAVFNQISQNCDVYLSANTTMQHLFEGLPVESLGRAPYTPVNLRRHSYEIHRRGRYYRIHSLEGISAFVGADIVSGIRELEMDKREEITLLVDLGTNGEMALGNRDKLVVTSAAAGPAFESNSLALELHASGMIDLLYEMKEGGVMDESGTLTEEFFRDGYKGMNQDMIRELQMAKAAIKAGIVLLLKKYDILETDVDKVYLAGGMGRFINIEHACAIGLLPQSFEKKAKAVGNTSLLGCLHYGRTPWDRPPVIQELVLAEQEAFQDLYIQEMNF